MHALAKFEILQFIRRLSGEILQFIRSFVAKFYSLSEVCGEILQFVRSLWRNSTVYPKFVAKFYSLSACVGKILQFLRMRWKNSTVYPHALEKFYRFSACVGKILQFIRIRYSTVTLYALEHFVFHPRERDDETTSVIISHQSSSHERVLLYRSPDRHHQLEHRISDRFVFTVIYCVKLVFD